MPGHEAKFVRPLLKRHECPICLFAMRNPVQTECGHLFCKDCLDPVLRRRRPICPLDQEPITQDGIFPDNACRREILHLEVYCDYMTGGCSWIGALKDQDSHSEICEYRDIQCTQCGQYIQFLVMRRHQDVECPMRPEPCSYCGNEVPVQQMQAHLDKVCLEVLHTCPNGCDPMKQMKLPELERHLALKGGDCPLAEVHCPFNVYGCSFVSQRRNISKHLEQYSTYHAQIQAECFIELKQKEEKTTAAWQHLMERVASLETRASAIERLQDALDQRVGLLDDRRERQVDRYGGRIESLEDQIARLHNNVSQLQKQFEEVHISPYSTYSTTGQRTNFSSGYESGVHILQSLGATNTAAGAVSPQRIETLQAKILELDHGLERLQSSSIDQELRLQLIERVSYNGVLLWKVDEFERRRKEAVEGVTLSLYSTPFYTSRQGYKMCARAYLNGDGLGKGSHLSFFFVIMRGPCDALLPWPFRQKVTLTLINQAGKKHMTDSFRPDPHSSSFQRPGRKEMNIASGCPMFIRIEHLLNGGFVKDDAIYLRVVVETSDLPKIIP